jgi:2-polyprenyl-3-methyl-5-hydroxy-6-metoxy-1,4-benzoquinol methylase
MYNIPKFYDDLCLSLGKSCSACGWDSEETQYSHFVLLSSILKKNSTVLDVGCGQGDFYQYLKNINLDIDYFGIDFSEQMIKIAQQKFGNSRFSKSDFFSTNSSYDFVIASGTFNFIVENQYEYIKKSIELCFKNCKKACAIALTSDLAKFKYEEPVFYYCPKKILEISLCCTPKVVLNTSSFEDEFVLFMYKDLL